MYKNSYFERSQSYIKHILKKIFELPKNLKLYIQILLDTGIMCLSFFFAFALRLDGVSTSIPKASYVALLLGIIISILAYLLLGLYKSVVRYISDKAIILIFIGTLISALTIFSIGRLPQIYIPKTVPVLYFIITFMLQTNVRHLVRVLNRVSKIKPQKNVLIYGTGRSGFEALSLLNNSDEFKPALFIDTTGNLMGRKINGIPVESFSSVGSFAKKHSVTHAVVATDDKTPGARRRITKDLVDAGLEVRWLPDVTDIMEGGRGGESLAKVTIEDLLGREPVSPSHALMSKTISGRSVMITGAGGSIGSQLCREIINYNPNRIILFEQSEYALYKIFDELQNRTSGINSALEIVATLGSTTDVELLRTVIELNDVNTFFHAAAYKHVSIVQNNPKIGLENNVYGTLVAADVAGQCGVKNFTLISTDKAVRPTNMMGASKRLAELAVLEMARIHKSTTYCAVRFGNVLGSSGSVIPKFYEQIKRGGPVTVTDPLVTRYFMTIPEAAQLVIQASGMSHGSEIYTLDMGRPVKILDLAKNMCTLHGKQCTVEKQQKQSNDIIEIQFTGLLPGEKLHEELNISPIAEKTKHPKIQRDALHYKKRIHLLPKIQRILNLETNQDILEETFKLLQKIDKENSTISQQDDCK